MDGRRVGRVHVTVNLMIMDAGLDWVLGTWRSAPPSGIYRPAVSPAADCVVPYSLQACQ